ncbi:MAG: hypothetical protein BJ554DRAFT_5184 [Olpidium bornovanus]|uniref:Uncharacterized protein n=1 Tax=Olpidium bornovanus TaxID=278681 RepID=A0A8H8DEB2_9FUNG|nr:MAG: hypothetical protein BJ554DRAFT_5184 [Olpidium bornovanus]
MRNEGTFGMQKRHEGKSSCTLCTKQEVALYKLGESRVVRLPLNIRLSAVLGFEFGRLERRPFQFLSAPALCVEISPIANALLPALLPVLPLLHLTLALFHHLLVLSRLLALLPQLRLQLPAPPEFVLNEDRFGLGHHLVLELLRV